MQKIIPLIMVLTISISIYAQEIKQDSSSISTHVIDAYLFNEYELGYSLLNNKKSEIRVLFGISSNYWSSSYDEEREDNSNGVLSENESTFDSDNGHLQLNLKAQYLYNIYNSNLGSSHIGIGPFLGYRSHKSSSSNNRNGFKSKDSNEEDNFLIGVTALVGIRSYLTNSLSIFAESHFNIYKSLNSNEQKNNNEEYDYNYKSSSEGNGWGYEIYYVRFGLRFSI